MQRNPVILFIMCILFFCIVAVLMCVAVWEDLVEWHDDREGQVGFGKWLVSGFGLFSTGNPKVERAIHVAQRKASLSKHILFLSRTQQVFKLWHVIHRPFSYAFAILAIIHIALVLVMGYRIWGPMDNFVSFFIAASIIVFFLITHLRGLKKRDAEAQVAAAAGWMSKVEIQRSCTEG